MSYDLPVPVGLTIIGLGIFAVWLFIRAKTRRINLMPDIPPTLLARGFEVPVLATFTGSKTSSRQTSFAHNSLNPTFMLFEDRLECRVILKKSIPINEIENVDIWDTVMTRNLIVSVKGRDDTFTANLLNRKNLARVLSFFQQRGTSLSSRARDFLSANSV